MKENASIDANSSPTRSHSVAVGDLLDANRTLAFLVTRRLAERVESQGDRMKTSELKRIQKKSAEVIALLDPDGHAARTRPIGNRFDALLKTFESATAQRRPEEADEG